MISYRTLRRIILLLGVVQAELLALHFGIAAHVAPAAVVLIEGGDHMSAAQFTRKGWSAVPSSVQTGRFDGQCWRFAGTSSTNTTTKALPSTYTTLFAGFALRPISSLNAAGSFSDVFFFQASGTHVWRLQHSSTVLRVVNSAGTVIASGTTTLVLGNWYYVEVKAVINGASGSCEVHLNGTTEIASTAGNFGSTAIDTIGFIRTAPGSGASNSYGYDWDDMWVADTTGTALTGFIGDVRIETVAPTADGAHTAWTPSSGGTHFNLVDEPTASDDDTTYVSDATPGDIDTYAFADIDGGATVYGAQLNLTVRKDDANTRQTAPVSRQSGTDHVGTTFTEGSGYTIHSQLYPQDPTGTNWTPATINGDEFGIKEIA